MSITRTVEGDREAVLAGSASGGAMASWLAEVTGQDGIGLLADPAQDAGGIVVAPYPRGRQTPDPDPDARVRVTGPDGDVDPRAVPPRVLARAVLDGLATHLAWMDRRQRSLLGSVPSAERFVLVGGAAAANRAWTDARSLALGVPVETLAGAEPVATGAALLAGVRTGVLDAVPVPPTVPTTIPTTAQERTTT